MSDARFKSEMDYPTFEITENDDGLRPAGRPDECFYCNQGIGSQHAKGCVITWTHHDVELVALVPFTESVPDHLSDEQIDFRFNESTWCVSNVWDKLDSCGCDRTVVVRASTLPHKRIVR